MDACDALPAFANALNAPCEASRHIARGAVYLPTYAALTPAQRDVIVRAVKASAP